MSENRRPTGSCDAAPERRGACIRRPEDDSRGWKDLGEKLVSVRVPVGVTLKVRPEGERFRARVEVGAMRIDVTSPTEERAVAKVLEHASVALGRALAVA